MSHHDKFWEKFGQKIRRHQPEAYTDGDWNAMEQMLDDVSGPGRKLNWQLPGLVFLALVLGYLAGLWCSKASIPEGLGAFPIPMPGIAQIEKVEPARNPAQLPSAFPASGVEGHSKSAGAPAHPATSFGMNSSQADQAHTSVPMFDIEPGLNIYTTDTERNLAKNGKEGSLPHYAGKKKEEKTAAFLSSANNLSIEMPELLPAVARFVTSQRFTEKDLLPTNTSTSASRRTRQFYGGFFLGANYSLTNLPDATSTYPFGGFFAGFRVGPRWAVQAEAHLKYVNNLSIAYEESARLESNNGYFFDQISRGTAQKDFFALETPLLGKYQLNRQWSLLAGLRPSFILEKLSLPGKQQEDALSAAPTTGQVNNAASSSEPKLRSFDLGVSAGVEWSFHRHWGLGVRFTKGCFDLSSGQAIEENKKYYNTDLQFSAYRKF